MAGLIRLYRTYPVQCYVHTKEDYFWSLTQALDADPHDVRAVYKESSPTGITEVRTNRLAGEMHESHRAWPIEEKV